MKYLKNYYSNGLIVKDIFERNYDYIRANEKQREKNTFLNIFSDNHSRIC